MHIASFFVFSSSYSHFFCCCFVCVLLTFLYVFYEINRKLHLIHRDRSKRSLHIFWLFAEGNWFCNSHMMFNIFSFSFSVYSLASFVCYLFYLFHLTLHCSIILVLVAFEFSITIFEYMEIMILCHTIFSLFLIQICSILFTAHNSNDSNEKKLLFITHILFAYFHSMALYFIFYANLIPFSSFQ